MKPSLIDRTFFKFVLVGIINTAVGMGIMFSLYNIAKFDYWLSSAANYVFTSILSFFLNKYFTFSIKQWSFLMVIAFSFTIIISYLLAYGIAKPIVYHILSDLSQKNRDNAALFVGMCLFTGLNYTGQRFFVFKRRKNEQCTHQ